MVIKRFTPYERRFIIQNYLKPLTAKELAYELKRPLPSIYNFIHKRTVLESSIDISRRKRKIFKQKFNGYNQKQLAAELQISESLAYHYVCAFKISKKHKSY